MAFTLLESLKFVRGAVAKKDLLPALTHFKIEDGTIRSYNGTIALCSPIDINIECVPKAEPLMKAIANCKTDTVAMHITPANRLSIRCGPFKAFVDCVTEETPHVVPGGEIIQVDGVSLLAALKTVFKFVGTNAVKPWSTGVLFKGQSAFATNNVAIIEYWVGVQFPIVCNIPRVAVAELIRINEPPVSVQIDEKSLSFLYGDGRWLRTNLLDIGWPDVGKVLDAKSNPVVISEELFDALDVLAPFTDGLGRVFFDGDTLSTSVTDDSGANYTIPVLNATGVYNCEMLSLLKGVATHIDFSMYPAPCMFFGNNIRGAVIGLKV